MPNWATPDLDRRILELWAAPSTPTKGMWQHIRGQLDLPAYVSTAALRMRAYRLKEDAERGVAFTELPPEQPDPAPATMRQPTTPFRLDRPPLAVDVPPSPATPTRDRVTALLYGDSHFPYHDPKTLQIITEVARRVQPDFLVHMGDLLDCYDLSRFDKNPKRLTHLQDEVDLARAHLAAMRLVTPGSFCLWLEGNHEDRLRRCLWNLPEAAKALLDLDVVSHALTWPAILGTEELGWEFVPYTEQTSRNYLPHWILKHGTTVRKWSAYTARSEWEHHARSGSSGHTHRLGAYFHRDYNGVHAWFETGCTCRLDPEYAQDPNWHPGCLVVTFDRETGAFFTEIVHAYNGRAMFRGDWLEATE